LIFIAILSNMHYIYALPLLNIAFSKKNTYF